MIEKTYNYFYKITNKINSKFYYGIHSTNDLLDGYMGSGNLIKSAIKKYGKENFEKEIIANYLTRREASDHEMKIVTIELCKNILCYNNRVGGANGNRHTDVTCQKISKALTGRKVSDEIRKRMSESRMGHYISDDVKDKIRKGNVGKRRSVYTKHKMSKSKTGKNNPLFGKSHTANTKKKMSEAATGRIPSCALQCVINGMYFSSSVEAAEYLQIHPITVRNRIRSDKIKWIDWNLLMVNKNEKCSTKRVI